MEIYSVKYGRSVIEFSLKRTDRKTLGITVHPNTDVEVTAPDDARQDKIKSAVEKKARWIIRQQRYFEHFLPAAPKREYVSGETHWYSGKQYRLKIEESTENSVKLIRGRLIVRIRNKDNKNRVKQLLGAWYKSKAEKKFESVLNDVLTAFKRYNIPDPRITIKRMEKRWGSCSPEGVITLNPDLIKAPRYCIEYVIIHELCHLIHPHHNKAFYRLQSRILPDAEKRKFALEKISAKAG